MTGHREDADERLARVVLQTLGVPDARLRLLGRGLSSKAWLVRSPAADRDWVLRIAVTCAAGSTYEREHAVLARVLDTLEQSELDALRVPRPVQGSWTLGSPQAVIFSVTERLDGPGLAPVHAAQAAAPIGRALRALHDVDVCGLGLPDSARGWPFDDTAVHPLFASRLTGWADDIRQVAATQPRVLVHGDLHEENILWPLAEHPDGSTVGFLDFGMASAGAAGWDFAALAYFLSWRISMIALTSYLHDGELSRMRRQAQLLALSFAHYRLVTAEDRDEICHAMDFIDQTLRSDPLKGRNRP
ncbi:MAG: aminoglycoside phosphotransferase family protein [Actinomycetota bacterium]|nr:aminoglycoside phosphotransferase family protein [Actinomycetota bacterium]